MSFAKMVKTVKKNSKNSKILIMGLDNAGKSTILSKFLDIEWHDAPTFGYKIYNKKFGDHLLTLLDIGGQETFKKFWTNYFEAADGIVFVVDSSDHRSYFEYLKDVVDLEIPVALIFNKIDLCPEFDLETMKNKIESDKLKCLKASGINKIGINEGFEWIPPMLFSLIALIAAHSASTETDSQMLKSSSAVDSETTQQEVSSDLSLSKSNESDTVNSTSESATESKDTTESTTNVDN